MPPSPTASGRSLTGEKTPKRPGPGKKDGWISWIRFSALAPTPLLGIQTGPGDSTTHHVLAPVLEHQTENWGRAFVRDNSVFSASRLSMEGPYAMRMEIIPLMSCSRGQKSSCPSTACSGAGITQSTSHFGVPQPAPGLHPARQSPPGLLLHWAPSPAPCLWTLPCVPLHWRP